MGWGWPCWRAAGPVDFGREGVAQTGQIRWASDGQLTFGVIEIDEREIGIDAAAEKAYSRLLAFAGRSATPRLLRIWNYLDAITLGDGDAERYVAEAIADGVDTVIAAGGDGTLSEVATTLAHRDATADALASLGLVPLGTANDFATAAEIPVEAEAALDLVRTSAPRPVDMLRIAFPYLLFISMMALAASVLNSFGKFALPAATPVLHNLTMIAAMLWLAPKFAEPVKALAWGMLAAGILQLLVLWPALVRLGIRPTF